MSTLTAPTTSGTGRGQPASTRRAVTTSAASATTTAASPTHSMRWRATPLVARNRRCDGPSPTATARTPATTTGHTGRPGRRLHRASPSAAPAAYPTATPTRRGRLPSHPSGSPTIRWKATAGSSPAASGRTRAAAAPSDPVGSRCRIPLHSTQAPPRPAAASTIAPSRRCPGRTTSTSPARAQPTTSPTRTSSAALRPSSPTSRSPPRASPAPTGARATAGCARRSPALSPADPSAAGPSMVVIITPIATRRRAGSRPRPARAGRRPGWPPASWPGRRPVGRWSG